MKIHPWQAASWQFGWEFGIHPDDFSAAINARIKKRHADSKRKARNPKTLQAIEEDLYVTWLASEGIAFWSDRTRNDMINYAYINGAATFFMKLGKAMLDGKTELFDQLDISILENWREGYRLREKTRAEAVKILREKHLHKSLEAAAMLEAKEFYASRVKRNGLSQGAASDNTAAPGSSG